MSTSAPGGARTDDSRGGTASGWDSLSLFDELVAHAVDDDYRVAAARRGDGAEDGGAGPARTRGSGLAVAAVVAAFAALVAVSAVQTRNDRPRLQGERESLVAEIQEQRGFLDDKREQGVALRGQVDRLLAAAPAAGGTSRVVPLRRAVGQLSVRGDGVQVVADNAEDARDEPRGRVTDRDLQVLVNGLWLAGAEAISVNGNRLTTLSSIRTAGEAITVNYRSLRAPYVVSAIGDPRTLESRFLDTPSGQAWTSLQKNYGLRFDTRVRDDMLLPAAPARRLQLRHATRLEDAS